MDTALKDINEVITYKPSAGNTELAFVYNILMPDFLLFTVGLSIVFALLMAIFGVTY